MSKKKLLKKIKKLENQMDDLNRDLALFSTRSEATASRTAFYEVELDKVKNLFLEARGKLKDGNVLVSEVSGKSFNSGEIIEETEKHIGREGLFYRGEFYYDIHLLEHMGEDVKLQLVSQKGEKVIVIFDKDNNRITEFPLQRTGN